MKLYFSNKGHFDVRAMLTFGVSAKDSDTAIGYFGTGFKYAVAIILRLGGSITVRTGCQVYEFKTCTTEIRGKDFDIVFCNGDNAGFTTRLGINWEPWQAFRELWCNCMDEGGKCDVSPLSGDTIIEVECEQVVQAYHDRDVYFLGEGMPIHSTDTCDVYDKQSGWLYFKGVAVQKTGKPGLYTYNVKRGVELTEDRTPRYSFQLDWPIKRAIQSATSVPMLRKIVTSKDKFESEIGYDADFTTSDEFVETVRQVLATGTHCVDSARRLVQKINDKAGNWPEVLLTRVQHTMLERARSSLYRIGIDCDMFPIKIVNGLGDGVMGRSIDGVMYLSLMPFNMGTKQVASTLMEEWVHCKHGCNDFDRTMQNWLFDKILSLAEEIVGEPI
jgi:hypothetical protein